MRARGGGLARRHLRVHRRRHVRDAGFVQVIEGKVDDPERLRTLLKESGQTLHERRPELIGGTLAIEDDGTFIETIAFTDEATAREHEPAEMPAELAQAHLRDVQYMDLHHPWFASRAD